MRKSGVLSGPADLLFVCAMAVAGALGGSFLNVVVHRGPALWGLVPARPGEARLGLAKPRSHCPACKTPLRPWALVPIVSYIALRGRCSACGAAIPRRYVILEALGLAFGVLSALIYAPAVAAAALLFSLALLAAATVDAETGYLPDALTGPGLWIALLTSAVGGPVPPGASIVGAAVGYLVFRGIGGLYAATREREGLGQGDAKLLAAGGAWTGPFALPLIVFVAALAGIAFAIASGRRRRDAEVRFGPFLLIGIVAAVAVTAALPGLVVPAWPWG